MKLWGSRFSRPSDPLLARLNDSFRFDVRLFEEDLDVNAAWARALQRAGLLAPADLAALLAGLETIRGEFRDGRFEARPTDEDIHTAVERRLGEVAGPAAGRIHTGRSRNDQVATDLRLWVMRAGVRLRAELAGLLRALLDAARADPSAPLPGYTHMRAAQPLTFGHWILAHFWPVVRDAERFAMVRRAASVLPLGSGALAGTAFPIDRDALADDLGFEAVSENSFDAVSDRDFAAGFLYASALAGVHLSRLAEQIILFSGSEFGFFALDDAWATGSSLMPQKRNPDPLELARGRAGTLIGGLTGLLATLKGLPSAYDKDLQEDKLPLFEAFDTLALLLPVTAGVIATLRLNPDRMRQAIGPDVFATDLADHLVRRGTPFREAHALAGRAVRLAEERGVPLASLPATALREISPAFGDDLSGVFDLEASLGRRAARGGTAPAAVRSQIEAAEKALAGLGA